MGAPHHNTIQASFKSHKDRGSSTTLNIPVSLILIQVSSIIIRCSSLSSRIGTQISLELSLFILNASLLSGRIHLEVSATRDSLVMNSTSSLIRASITAAMAECLSHIAMAKYRGHSQISFIPNNSTLISKEGSLEGLKLKVRCCLNKHFMEDQLTVTPRALLDSTMHPTRVKISKRWA